MMRKIMLHIILLIGLDLNLSAQVNLVPNPSFEFFTTCPNSFDQISYAYPWYMPTLGTSDYFNSCDSGIMGVPTNSFGYQPARTGVGYAGAGVVGSYREYISCRLNDTLIKDKNYCVEFYINLSNVTFFVASDSLVVGMYISNDSISDPSSQILPYSPQIFTAYSQYVNDTSGWTIISGTYLASGGETFITLGIYYSDNSIGGGGYFYFEDVSITECKDDTIVSITIPNIFTPNNDGINDFFEIKNLPEKSSTQIFNRWGIKVFETTKSNVFWDGRTTSGIESVDGTYYYIITTEEEEVYKGFLQLIH
jgi:gliding motility-associated-like protein